MNSTNLKIKIYSDGADAAEMVSAAQKGIVKGFTTNPTLMKKSGVTDYEAFAKDVLSKITALPISFEVFSDDFESMEKEALKISSWGENVYVKIPVTNTQGVSSVPLIKTLSRKGLKLNITAILTLEQVRALCDAFDENTSSIISVFAGRIADTGRDPVPYMKEAKRILYSKPKLELLWASSREVLNIIQAEECGCDIITVTNDLLKKLSMFGKDLKELSLDTVKMFYNDAESVGYKIL
ncbi:MAG: transaldolase [Ignavibacteria bacterium]|jgi:transaldolase|nr:transaldolase [Ignavibacteria bacterium]